MSNLANGTRYYDDGTYTSEDPIHLPDTTTILVEAGTAAVEIYLSMNTPEEIDGVFVESWYLYKTVALGTFNFEAIEYGANAMKLKFTGTMKAWVKG